jgi:hypothetical protein
MITYHDDNMIRKRAIEEMHPERKKKKSDEVDIDQLDTIIKFK